MFSVSLSDKQDVIEVAAKHFQKQIAKLKASREYVLRMHDASGKISLPHSNIDVTNQLCIIDEKIRIIQSASCALDSFAHEMTAVQEGALVWVTEDSGESLCFYFLIREGGGAEVLLRSVPINVILINPAAPRARALIGKSKDAVVTFLNNDGQPEVIKVLQVI